MQLIVLYLKQVNTLVIPHRTGYFSFKMANCIEGKVHKPNATGCMSVRNITLTFTSCHNNGYDVKIRQLKIYGRNKSFQGIDAMLDKVGQQLTLRHQTLSLLRHLLARSFLAEHIAPTQAAPEGPVSVAVAVGAAAKVGNAAPVANAEPVAAMAIAAEAAAGGNAADLELPLSPELKRQSSVEEWQSHVTSFLFKNAQAGGDEPAAAATSKATPKVRESLADIHQSAFEPRAGRSWRPVLPAPSFLSLPPRPCCLPSE